MCFNNFKEENLTMKEEKITKQKELLKKIFTRMLETNIEIMNFQMTLTDKANEIKGLRNFVKQTEKAIKLIQSVNHYEILVSLYNTFVNGKETYYVALCKTINNKETIVKWDRTEKGFKLFLQLENEAKAKSKEEYEKKVAQQEMIKKAKEDGKIIEMVYTNGKLEPRIVEES